MKFSKTAMMVVAGGMLASTLVMAQQKATSERQAQFAIDTRQAVLTLLGSNMAPLAGMLKREIPYSQELVQKNASRLVQLAHMLPDTFMVDTSEIDIETEALDGIWKNKADFDAKTQAFIEAAEALAAVSQDGNEGAVKQAIGAVGKTCGGCHDVYRAD